ncbi:MAG: TAXI family TRAP transporter solute-binding subunit [Desulfovibrionaceae bacterium]|nr:TAXI family TRAP transporter solute-binding subunit [Desulfovibrionaceae bacterium]
MLKKFLASILCAAAFAVVPLSSHAAGEKKIDIAAAAPGGAWFVGLGAYAKVLSAMYPEFDTTLFSGGGVTNVVRVERGQSAVGITANTFMKAAEDGVEPFKSSVRVKALANLDDVTRIIFAVPANSKIMTVRDIVESKAPLRIYMGSKVGGNAEVFARWVFEALGATKKELQERGCTLYGGTPAECGTMMREGQIDVMSITAPGEHFMISELIKNMDIRFLPFDDALIADLKASRALSEGTLPSSMYQPMIKEDIPIMTAPSGLVINADVPEEDAYKMARALVEGRDDIAVALPAWSTISPERVCKELPIEIHPGAVKYFREIGCMD